MDREQLMHQFNRYDEARRAKAHNLADAIRDTLIAAVATVPSASPPVGGEERTKMVIRCLTCNVDMPNDSQSYADHWTHETMKVMVPA